ncbi:MAG: ABC transporter permease [Candidatus Anammoxibacter sp.]
MVTNLWSNRRLIWIMAKHDLIGRYKGSFLGFLWSLVNPIIILLIYTFVFGIVFKARWGNDQHNFALVIYSGLIFYWLLNECLVRSPLLVISNVNYVKKVVFPLESLSVVLVTSSLFHFVISTIILLIAQIALNGSVPWTWIYLPLVTLPLVLMCLGTTLILSSLGVYIKDIAQIAGIFSTVLLFMSPILYPIEIIPEQYRSYLYLNPLTFIVVQARLILLYEHQPDFFGLFKYMLIAIIFAQFSYWWFIKTKKGFVDVI